jgi:hypothetical protein
MVTRTTGEPPLWIALQMVGRLSLDRFSTMTTLRGEYVGTSHCSA